MEDLEKRDKRQLVHRRGASLLLELRPYAQPYSLIYAVMVFVGGVIGFMTSGSKKSIIMGSSVSALILATVLASPGLLPLSVSRGLRVVFGCVCAKTFLGRWQ